MRRKSIYKVFAFIILVLGIITVLFKFYEFRKGQTPNTDSHKADNINWVSTKQGNIHIRIFKNKSLNDSISLAFILHGDAPFNKPSYQYIMAEKIAEENENTIAIAILRPGYTDPQGNTSNGVKGHAVGDNYTSEVIEAISEVMEKIKKKYNPSKTFVVGHSGGAAITGNIIGLKPGSIDVAVLVSCPCDVLKWRKHMSKKQPLNPLWYLKVKSISPISVAKDISRETEVVIISGANDDIAPISLSKEYYKELKTLGIKTDFISLPNEGHEILLSDPVLNSIKNNLKK
jgi:predicted esterase